MALASLSRISSICGNGYLSLIVMLLRDLKSMHIRNEPSGFVTGNILKHHGLLLFLIILAFNNFFINLFFVINVILLFLSKLGFYPPCLFYVCSVRSCISLISVVNRLSYFCSIIICILLVSASKHCKSSFLKIFAYLFKNLFMTTKIINSRVAILNYLPVLRT